MEAAQTLAWPNSDMSVLTKFTAAKVRSVLPEELVHSDVLQTLSLQNQSWQYQFMVCVAARRDFSFSSFIVWPLGFSGGFSPTGVCSQGCPRSHESAPARKGYRRGGGCGHKCAYYAGDRVKRIWWWPLGPQGWGSLQLRSQESHPGLK